MPETSRLKRTDGAAPKRPARADGSRDTPDGERSRHDGSRVALGDELAASAILEERSRLARELHDGLAGHLAFLKMRVGWLRGSAEPVEPAALQEVEDVLAVALTEVRQAIAALRAGGDETTPVGDMIARHAAEFGQMSGLGIRVVQDVDLPAVGPRVRAELVRIVQEALNNTRRHAEATGVEVEIRARRAGLEVTLRDDGRGFGAHAGGRGHYGLAIMRERAESIGGTVEIQSGEGEGTMVRVWAPALSVESA